eukprot:3941683-Rhodomonas_salina.1
MGCPVLTWRMVLGCVSGTDVACGGSGGCPVLTYRMVLWVCGTGADGRSLVRAPLSAYTMSGTDTAYGASAYARTTRCPVLTKRVVLSAYARATRCPVLTKRVVLSAYACATQCPVLTKRMVLRQGVLGVPQGACDLHERGGRIVRPLWYAICLRHSLAIFRMVLDTQRMRMVLCVSTYGGMGLCGTELLRTVVWGVRDWRSVWCYAMCGTGVGYGDSRGEGSGRVGAKAAVEPVLIYSVWWYGLYSTDLAGEGSGRAGTDI